MGRRKSKVKVPFIKTKVSIGLLQTLFGLTIISTCTIILYSLYSTDVEALQIVKSTIIDQFGYVIILFLVVGILFGIKSLSPRGITFIKWHWQFGLFLIALAMLGLLRSGTLGVMVFDELTSDFTIFGSLGLLSMLLLVGIIIFFDTSLEALIAFIFSIFGSTSPLKIKGNIKSKELDKNDEEIEFIRDSKVKLRTQLPNPNMAKSVGDVMMRPTNIAQDVSYNFPSINLLNEGKETKIDKNELAKNASIIERTLDSYGVRAKVEEINPGPTVTQYALAIASGTNLNKITSLSNELALTLASVNGTVRVEAPIPGRSLIGIEIPNHQSQLIVLKKMIFSDELANNHSPLAVPLGYDVGGTPIIADLAKMPHVLIAGTTGSGKSVVLNTWICTWLYRARPQDVRMILIDPKRVELSVFNHIPHLLTPPIVEMEKAVSALAWAVKEMDRRYQVLQECGVRNLEEYRNLPKNPETLPYIVIAIDELADLMVVAAKEAETLIQRIAQKARAVGIHLVLATQRPSVNVITGVIKANIPTRIAFNVASVVDSKVILDSTGAEKLLGKGDMLYQAPDRPKAVRIQAAYVSIEEVKAIVDFLRAQHPVVHYTTEIVAENVQMGSRGGLVVKSDEEDRDAMFDQAVAVVTAGNTASASYLQRQLKLGYARAARILDQMEQAGIIGPPNGSKPREIYKRFEE